MSHIYTWICGCGLEGRGEDNARQHANDGCTWFGWPGTSLHPDVTYRHDPDALARAARAIEKETR